MHQTSLAIGCTCLLMAATAHAADAGAGETRVQFGLAFPSGMSDLRNKIRSNNPQLEIRQLTPVGLGVAVYRDMGDGLAIGGTLGPAIIGTGAVSFTVVPLGLDVRYRFARSGSTAPYVRAGVEKAIVGGDTLDAASAGGVLAVGVEIAQPRSAGWGVELAYHSTQVAVSGRGSRPALKAKPYQGVLSVFYAF
jgi:hypothetical protein